MRNPKGVEQGLSLKKGPFCKGSTRIILILVLGGSMGREGVGVRKQSSLLKGLKLEEPMKIGL